MRFVEIYQCKNGLKCYICFKAAIRAIFISKKSACNTQKIK